MPLYLKAAKAAPASETAAWATLQRARCLANLDRRDKALDIYDLFKKDYRKSGWADEGSLRRPYERVMGRISSNIHSIRLRSVDLFYVILVVWSSSYA